MEYHQSPARTRGTQFQEAGHHSVGYFYDAGDAVKWSDALVILAILATLQYGAYRLGFVAGRDATIQAIRELTHTKIMSMDEADKSMNKNSEPGAKTYPSRTIEGESY